MNTEQFDNPHANANLADKMAAVHLAKQSEIYYFSDTKEDDQNDLSYVAVLSSN